MKARRGPFGPLFLLLFLFCQKKKVAQKEKGGEEAEGGILYVVYMEKSTPQAPEKSSKKVWFFAKKDLHFPDGCCILLLFACGSGDNYGLHAGPSRRLPAAIRVISAGPTLQKQRSGGKNSGQGGILNRRMCGRKAAHKPRVRKHTAPCTAQSEKEEETITWQTKESASS